MIQEKGGFLGIIEEYLKEEDPRYQGPKQFSQQIRCIKTMFNEVSKENDHKNFILAINIDNFTDVINAPYNGDYKRYIKEQIEKVS